MAKKSVAIHHARAEAGKNIKNAAAPNEPENYRQIIIFQGAGQKHRIFSILIFPLINLTIYEKQ